MTRKSVGVGLSCTTAEFVRPASKGDSTAALETRTAEVALPEALTNLSPLGTEELRSLQQCLAQTLSSLGGRGRTLALSLPDSAGRTLWLSLPSPAKSVQERSEMARWALRDRLPLPIDQCRVTTMVTDPDNGSAPILVSLLHQTKAQQLEELVDGLGHRLLHLNFYTPHLWQTQLPKLKAADYLLIVQTPFALTWSCVRQGKMVAFRQKMGEHTPRIGTQETRRTLVEWGQNGLTEIPSHRFVLGSNDLQSALSEILGPIQALPQDIAPGLANPSFAQMAALGAVQCLEGVA